MNIVEKDQAAADRLTKARSQLLIDEPFFGALAMRLKYVEDNTIPTLNVNGTVVRYNAPYVKSLELPLVKSAIAHEVMHCVLHHCGADGRGINLNPGKWGHAVDYVVNQVLVDAGFELGEGWLHNPQYAGMSAEHIYSLLPEPPPSNGKAPNAGNPGPLDTVSPGTPDPAMQALEETEWQIATVQAANNAKMQGKLSATLEQFIDQVKKSKIDWKAELRQFISRIAKGDYAWNRPNKKMLAAGFILPGLYSEEIGTIVIAADESGSVDKAVTEAFAAEINAIKEDLRPEKITLMHFDSEVRKTEEFNPDDEFKMIRYCNGGTDFRPACAAAEQLDTAPMCMIYLTDMYGSFPAAPPDFPVLWISISDLVGPFGDTLKIEV